MKKTAFIILMAISLLMNTACSSSDPQTEANTFEMSSSMPQSDAGNLFGRIDDSTSSEHSSTNSSEEDYKASCQQYDYKEIARYPAQYEGEKAYFQGYVQQVLEDGDDITLLVNTSLIDGIWDNTIIVWYTRQDTEEARILEGDIVDLWGELGGLYTYESLLGESITVPSMTAKYATYIENYEEDSNTTTNGIDSSTTETNAIPKSETELLSIIESQSGYTVDDYLYIDMDHDGESEMIAGYLNPDTEALDFWYCNSTGSECFMMNIDTGWLPYFSLGYLPYDDETHVIINTMPESGTGYFSILSKEGEDLYLLCNKNYGNAYQVGTDIQVSVDNMDAYYDPDMGFLSGHAYEETYIYYDGESYHEYPAIEISEAEFYSYQDAGLYPGIGFTPPSELDMMKFYQRDNGYLYIQLGVKNTDTGRINYFYYVYQLIDNRVVPVDGLTNMADGQIQEYLTDLD